MVRERARAVIDNLPADQLQPAAAATNAGTSPWKFVQRWLRNR